MFQVKGSLWVQLTWWSSCRLLETCVLSKFICEMLNPRRVALGGRAFGRWVSQGTQSTQERDSCPYKSLIRELVTHTERRWMSMGQEVGPTRHGICWYLNLELPSLQNDENTSLLFVSLLVYSILYSGPNWVREGLIPFRACQAQDGGETWR